MTRRIFSHSGERSIGIYKFARLVRSAIVFFGRVTASRQRDCGRGVNYESGDNRETPEFVGFYFFIVVN